MRRPLSVAALLSVLVVGLATDAAAQDERSRRRSPDREEMEARIRAQMQRVTKERLDLSEEESEELSEVIMRFEEQRRALRRSEVATRRRIDALVLDGGSGEEEAAELLAAILDLRRQEAELFAAEQEALLQVLPAAKVLQLQALREEMGRRLRSLRGRDEGRRRGGGGGRGNVDWLQGIDLST